MKRKIPIKKKANYIFGKTKHSRHPMFRKLIFTRTYRENFVLAHFLFHKNRLIKNFNFYFLFIKFLKFYKQIFFLYDKIKYNKNTIELTPLFFYKKQLFIKNIIFFDFLRKNNLNGYFIFKKFIKLDTEFNNKFNWLPGYKFNLVNLTNNELKLFENLNLTDEFKNLIFFLKHKEQIETIHININYTIWFQLNMLQILELYKIQQYLYVNSILQI